MDESLKALGEFGLIGALTASLRKRSDVTQGIGDDCAILKVGDRNLLLSCDASLEDVHFKRHWGQPEDIGWKAAVSALSDIAAMGGTVTAALVTLALPTDLPVAYVTALYQGLSDAVESTGAAIIGGDTTTSQSGIVLDLTVIGEVMSRAVLRSGAQPGDVIGVTGLVGIRGAGLYALLNDLDAPDFVREYLHPIPRLAAGQWLQAQPAVHAMMDISDGLLPDLRHIAVASHVDIDVLSEAFPESASLDAFWHQVGQDPCAQRLRSGEEYELVVAVSAAEAPELAVQFERHLGLPLAIVGQCSAGTGVVRVDGALPAATGFEHFRDQG